MDPPTATVPVTPRPATPPAIATPTATGTNTPAATAGLIAPPMTPVTPCRSAGALARLNIWATRSAGQEQPLNLWWDARRHPALLAAIVRTRRLLLFAEQPAPGALHPLGGQPLPPGVGLQFDTPLAELAALLAGLRG